MLQPVADYDSNDYDYRTYWDGRDYERWAEEHVLARLVPRLGTPDWLVDFGGGYGRNARHYRDRARHYVIADVYSRRGKPAEAQQEAARGRALESRHSQTPGPHSRR